jgi:hypothetical protein
MQYVSEQGRAGGRANGGNLRGRLAPQEFIILYQLVV